MMLRLLFFIAILPRVLAATPDRPNILFIFSDDHSPNAIGAYQRWLRSVNPTPAIDKLAAGGMLFERSYCTNSICGPVRAVIETGKHSHLNGFRQNGDQFDWDQQTFPKLLQRAGYQTVLYGKYHLDGTPQGYDEWTVLPGQGLYYNPDFITPAGRIRLDGHCTDLVTEMAVEWLKSKRDPSKPFLLRVQHKAPHRNWMPAIRHLGSFDDVLIPEPPTLFADHRNQASPSRIQEMEIDRHMHLNHDLFVDLVPDAEEPARVPRQDSSAYGNMKRMSPAQMKAWREYYGPLDEAFHRADLTGEELVRWKHQRYMRNYLACIKGVDESVETLVRTLEELDLAENTVVVYASDQGFYLGDRGWYDKRWMYEPSLEMPLIVKWPGVTQPGSRNHDLVQNLDYASTFLEMAGVAIPGDLQGRSLVPLLKGETPADWRDAIYYHYFEFPSVHMVARHRGVRTARYKLIHFYQFDEWEFYDLESDPQEQRSQYHNPVYAAQIAGLRGRLEELADEYGDSTDVSAKPREWREAFLAAAEVPSVGKPNNKPALEPDEIRRRSELDAYWATVSRAVAEGDFGSYRATCHPDGVLVSGIKNTSEPLSSALVRWRKEFIDTSEGRRESAVSFRFSKRIGDAASARETGIFLYEFQNAGEPRKSEYIHFDAVLTKRDGRWLIVLEDQQRAATRAEWNALAPAAGARK